MYYRSLVVILGGYLLVACESGSARVAGLLLDSLANRPVDSQFVYWTVGSTLDSTMTNRAGEFALELPIGVARLTYSGTGYESVDQAVRVSRDTVVELRLRRTVPFLRSFSVTPAGVLQATIVDLQGAATVAQDNATWVVLNYGTVAQSSAIQGPQWTWSPVDSLTWRVAVSTGSTSIINAYWQVTDGYFGTGFLCVPGQSMCKPDF